MGLSAWSEVGHVLTFDRCASEAIFLAAAEALAHRRKNVVGNTADLRHIVFHIAALGISPVDRHAEVGPAVCRHESTTRNAERVLPVEVDTATLDERIHPKRNGAWNRLRLRQNGAKRRRRPCFREELALQ